MNKWKVRFASLPSVQLEGGRRAHRLDTLRFGASGNFLESALLLPNVVSGWNFDGPQWNQSLAVENLLRNETTHACRCPLLSRNIALRFEITYESFIPHSLCLAVDWRGDTNHRTQ